MCECVLNMVLVVCKEKWTTGRPIVIIFQDIVANSRWYCKPGDTWCSLDDVCDNQTAHKCCSYRNCEQQQHCYKNTRETKPARGRLDSHDGFGGQQGSLRVVTQSFRVLILERWRFPVGINCINRISVLESLGKGSAELASGLITIIGSLSQGFLNYAVGIG